MCVLAIATAWLGIWFYFYWFFIFSSIYFFAHSILYFGRIKLFVPFLSIWISGWLLILLILRNQVGHIRLDFGVLYFVHASHLSYQCKNSLRRNIAVNSFESAWWNIVDGRFAMVRYPCWTFVPRLLPSCYDRLSSTVAYHFTIAAMTFTILKLNFEVTSFWILMIDKTREETVIFVFYSISNTIQGNTWPNRHLIDFNTNNSQNSNLFLCSKIYRYGRSC